MATVLRVWCPGLKKKIPLIFFLVAPPVSVGNSSN
jgi:hypothetical protein